MAKVKNDKKALPSKLSANAKKILARTAAARAKADAFIKGVELPPNSIIFLPVERKAPVEQPEEPEEASFKAAPREIRAAKTAKAREKRWSPAKAADEVIEMLDEAAPP